MLRRVVLAVPVLLVAIGLGVSGAPAGAATGPARIAALGDSITRAFDVNGSSFLRDSPKESWATGTDTVVKSQYLRLQALNSGITAENDAVTGAKMDALAGQMTTALGGGADYVTVLMGANDVCTKTVAGMTPASTVRTQVEAALAQTDGKNVRVFLSSIPRVNRLYELYSGSGSARFTWSLYGVCQDLLSSRATSADRAAVAQRVIDDNAQLQAACSAHAACAWDNGATYGIQFDKVDVSTVDYFHPSVTGQARLASVDWTASPYGH